MVLAGVGAVIGVVGIAYAVEFLRGQAAWADVEQLAMERGETLRLADLLPGPVQDSENFASELAPVWRGEVVDGWTLAKRDPQSAPPPDLGLWWRGEGVPLAEWRDYLGAPDLAAWLEDRHGADMKRMAEASRRPRACFSADHTRGMFFGMTFVPPMRDLTRLFVLRSTARLDAGDEAGALEDLLVALRLARALREEPFLLTQLSANTQAQWALQALREGLARGAWAATELKRVDDELARFDLLGNGMRALRGELAFAIELMGRLAEDSPEEIAEATGGAHGPAFVDHLPGGWVFQNMAGMGRLYLEDVFPAYDAPRRRLDPERLAAADRQVRAMRPTPYTVLTRMYMPPVQGAIVNCAAVQTQIELARLACALELHRRRTGDYPDSLEALPGGAGGAVDFVTGEAPRYRRAEGGAYALYTTGADGVDDGGVVRLTPQGKLDVMAGDWVWFAPAARAKAGRWVAAVVSDRAAAE